MAHIGTLSILACFFLLSTSFPLWTEAAINCDNMKDDISTCIGYFHGKEISPQLKCCNIMKQLSSAANTLDDLKDACQCIRDVAGKAAGFRPDRVLGINYLCGVKLPTKVFINTSCKDIRK